jgi:squalene-hopene/tetraprenyl-beta-curcumene cyclase
MSDERIAARTRPNSILESPAFERTRRAAVARLLAARTTAGHWSGRLSSSALSTATAIAALRLADRSAHAADIAAGAAWLVATQLADGSWGDTTDSPGNLSTTLLAWSALAAAADDGDVPEGSVPGIDGAVRHAAGWIDARTGGRDAATIAAALGKVYGRDRTFSVPILTHLALCGRFGDRHRGESWAAVPQLPFELAALPQAWFRAVDLQVVSYALPALIAIGQVRHAARPSWGISRLLRGAAVAPTLRTLAAIQPANGGFLEATPLTSFVTMSLAGMGRSDHAVARKGVAFLLASRRPDGSWPIDTNLATWCTTLSVAALAAGGALAEHLDGRDRESVRRWLLDQQWRRVHPATGAAAGGWAWTDLPGGVPDADDTSGAVAALVALETAEQRSLSDEVRAAVAAGLHWLTGLANRDGGIPTFCRGWNRLPFDTSCPDITAHFLRAMAESPLPTPVVARAAARARRYLATAQAGDGSWCPLWFGSQCHPSQANPAYGTAKVVLVTLDPRGARWLIDAVAADGGVGPAAGLPPSIEETAVTAEALARVAAESPDASLRESAREAVGAAVGWLIERTAEGTAFGPAPIGLYFAKLWYAEELYPLAFTVAALERAARLRGGSLPR